jgi:hypothetical protein
MKKHLCILICYNNVEHIIKCYENIKNNDIDFIIIENFSENTKHIKEYFIKQNIKKYFLFQENITNNAVNIVLKDHISILKEYKYITFSDCDLYLKNSSETFFEIFDILEINNIGVCCVDLSMDNLPDIPGSEGWIPQPKQITEKYIECDTGIHFMTFKNENIKIVENVNFLDSNLANRTKQLGKKWVKTITNKAVHLTWDLYRDNNEYYQYKVKNKNLWSHNKTSRYIEVLGEII